MKKSKEKLSTAVEKKKLIMVPIEDSGVSCPVQIISVKKMKDGSGKVEIDVHVDALTDKALDVCKMTRAEVMLYVEKWLDVAFKNLELKEGKEI